MSYARIPKIIKLSKNSNRKWVQLPSQIGLYYVLATAHAESKISKTKGLFVMVDAPLPIVNTL